MTTDTAGETERWDEESIEAGIERILNAFVPADGVYKKEEIDEAIALKDRIIPRLLGILKDVLHNPDKYKGEADEIRFDHIYALLLLGHFRETAAHPLIIDIFSFPKDISYDLYGDIGTSDLPQLLLRTCGGSLDLIRSMALNREVDDYCRVSALQAMAYASVEGFISVEDVQAFFGSLFTGDEADEDSDFWGLLACTINDLHPAENINILRKAFEDGLIFPGMIGLEEIEETFNKKREECIDALKSEMERGSFDDIHGRMSWWACFHEDEERDDRSGAFLPAHQNTKIKKVKKKKRKQAKASKRKNRKK